VQIHMVMPATLKTLMILSGYMNQRGEAIILYHKKNYVIVG
jgi:hypothetical protein